LGAERQVRNKGREGNDTPLLAAKMERPWEDCRQALGAEWPLAEKSVRKHGSQAYS